MGSHPHITNCARVAVIATFSHLIFRTSDVLIFAFLVLAVGAFGYRKYAEYYAEKSVTPRKISLDQLLRDSKFTVYAPDAFNAQEREKVILSQLVELKQRMIAVAPG